MAVFSERNDRPLVTKSCVKTSRRQGNLSKTLDEFMTKNKITVKIDSTGTPQMIVSEIQDGK